MEVDEQPEEELLSTDMEADEPHPSGMLGSQEETSSLPDSDAGRG